MHDRLSIHALHLFALGAFAFAQPLLDLLGSHPEFFAARQAPPIDVILVPLILLFAPAAAMWGVEYSISRISRRLEAGLHLSFVAVLGVIAVMPAIRPALADSGYLEVPIAVGGVALLGLAYARLSPLRQFVSVLAGAPLVFAAVYYSNDSIGDLIHPASKAVGIGADVESETPVVMIVFDELPLSSLLDERGLIDAIRYPAFARLAAESTWYRNASTVSARTLDAVPAILTGKYPPPRRVSPTLGAHPGNLFTLLADSHELNVIERHTTLSPAPKDVRVWTLRAQSLASDLGLIWLHHALPGAIAKHLPSVTRTWENFADAAGADARGPDPHGTGGEVGRADLFRDFIGSITASATPAFHYLHTALPHWPWLYLPSGKTFFPFQGYGSPGKGGLILLRGSEDWWALEAYQRHLLQVEFSDRLLGRLIDHLESIDLYDRVLFIVLADHGVSFWPNESARGFAKTRHPQDLLCVPMFIRTPGQRAGRLDIRNVEMVDVLPSVADVLETEVPWATDGCSVFDDTCEPRKQKRAFAASKHSNRTFTFGAGACSDDETLHRKLDAFGSGTRPYGLHRFGDYAALGGRDVSSLDVSASVVGEVELEDARRIWLLGPGDDIVPARVSGTVKWSSVRLEKISHIAVALNGTIQTVVPAPLDAAGDVRVAALLPEDALGKSAASREFSQDLRLYHVTGPVETPRLAPLEIVGD